LEKVGSKFQKPKIFNIINIFSVICLIASVVFFAAATKGAKDVGSDSEPVAIAKHKSETNKNSPKELITLKSQLEAANVKIKKYELSNQVSQVSTLYAQKKYIEAADRLMSLKVDDLTSDLKTKYDSMKDKVLLRAASQMTSEGNTLYKNKNFAEAIKKLEKVFALGDKWDFADKALYILGKSYVEVNDQQKATITYEKLIKEYPKSAYIRWAKDRLKDIQ
jgi:TolA-binding protein